MLELLCKIKNADSQVEILLILLKEKSSRRLLVLKRKDGFEELRNMSLRTNIKAFDGTIELRNSRKIHGHVFLPSKFF